MSYPQNGLFQTTLPLRYLIGIGPLSNPGCCKKARVMYGRKAEEGGIQGKCKRRFNMGGRNS